MYTVKEVCSIFKVCRRTVEKWIASGKIKAVKIGRNVRISAEEVERLKEGK